MNIFPDPLLALRLISVFFGLLTFIYFRKITPNFFASVFFVFSPFLLFYQRLGMQESLLVFLLTAATYYAFKNKYLMGGLFAGLSLLTKTTAFAYLIPLFIFKFNPKTIIVTLGVYLPFFFGLQSVLGHNSAYAGAIPPSQMVTNFKMSLRWLWEYQGPIGLLGVFTPPVIIENLIAKIFFPRYFLFVVPGLIIAATYLINRLRPKVIKSAIFLVLLVPNIILSLQIITNVKSANLPYIEKWQYLEAWPAGYGIKETAGYLRSQNLKMIITEDIMITRYGLNYYYPELKVEPYKKQKEGVFVFKRSKELVNDLGFEKIYNSYDVSVYRSRPGT